MVDRPVRPLARPLLPPPHPAPPRHLGGAAARQRPGSGPQPPGGAAAADALVGPACSPSPAPTGCWAAWAGLCSGTRAGGALSSAGGSPGRLPRMGRKGVSWHSSHANRPPWAFVGARCRQSRRGRRWRPSAGEPPVSEEASGRVASRTAPLEDVLALARRGVGGGLPSHTSSESVLGLDGVSG